MCLEVMVRFTPEINYENFEELGSDDYIELRAFLAARISSI
jgi:hypothetical protein